MTSLALFLSFLMLFVGGYGFSSTKFASLNLPLMQKIDPTIHSWAFMNPIICGLLLVVYAICSASERYARQVWQVVLAGLVLLILIDAPAMGMTLWYVPQGARPDLSTLLMAESGMGALVFCIASLRKIRQQQRQLRSATSAPVTESTPDIVADLSSH